MTALAFTIVIGLPSLGTVLKVLGGFVVGVLGGIWFSRSACETLAGCIFR